MDLNNLLKIVGGWRTLLLKRGQTKEDEIEEPEGPKDFQVFSIWDWGASPSYFILFFAFSEKETNRGKTEE